jgi:hypothetical protein
VLAYAGVGLVAGAIAALVDALVGGEVSVPFALAFGFLMAMLARALIRTGGPDDRPFTPGEWLAVVGSAVVMVLALVVWDLGDGAGYVVGGALLAFAASGGARLVVVHHRRTERRA